MRTTHLVVMLSIIALGSYAPTLIAAEFTPAQVDYFEKSVRPILVDHCYACHSAATKPSGNLRVDDRNGLLVGGNNGAAIVPGDASKSLLLKRVTQADIKRRMPIEGKHLNDEQVAILTKWINDGAAWPAVKLPLSLTKVSPQYKALREEHWAWQPLTQPVVPTVHNPNWAKDEIDLFLLAKLDEAELTPVADADRLTLIRRLTFDLTGLPPTPGAITAFVQDDTPDAVSRLVDRLLASPAFGERWGRHWLDVARYGESTGPSRNIPYPYAWKYRDYVIDAVNADVPFNRFIQEQIAGDCLPASSSTERDRLLTATGFLALGVKDVNQRFKVRFIMDNVDEQIDAVTRSVLGLTVSCARCHNHKFDPIPQADYYALAGIFTSTDNAAGVRNKMGGGGLDYYDPSMLLPLASELPALPAAQIEKLKADLALAQKEWEAIRNTPEGMKVAANGQPTQRAYRLKFERLQAALAAVNNPAARGHAVHGVRDAKVIADTEIRIRGEAEKLGPVVPRGFLSTINVPDAKSIPKDESGRLQLAQWLTSNDNPLTPRVIVNRAWKNLFGQGLVSTVDNFGVMGDTPSHPELLDYLSQRFIQDGWSIKRLVRMLVLTRAYQLSGEATDAHREIDPSNRLIWRHSPRRLDAEEFRDAALLVSGSLERYRSGASPAAELHMVEMRDNGPEAKNINTAADDSNLRSIYLPLVRGVTPSNLAAFDPVEQTLVTGQREVTNVPAQALFLLNSTFVRQQALQLADRALSNGSSTDADKIATLYSVTFGRAPTTVEVDRAIRFLGEYESGTIAESAQTTTAKVVPMKPMPKKKKMPMAQIIDPDQVDQTAEGVTQKQVEAGSPRAAAWMALAQALLGSAEFRYVP